MNRKAISSIQQLQCLQSGRNFQQAQASALALDLFGEGGETLDVGDSAAK